MGVGGEYATVCPRLINCKVKARACMRTSLSARRKPDMMEVGWIRFFTSSFPRFSSSAATITTEVVPSPTCGVNHINPCQTTAPDQPLSDRPPQNTHPPHTAHTRRRDEDTAHTSWSCKCASSTSTLAAGCSTSSCWRMVAPSFVMVTSPMSSTFGFGGRGVDPACVGRSISRARPADRPDLSIRPWLGSNAWSHAPASCRAPRARGSS